MREHLEDIETTDIFYMTGFTVAQNMCEMLMNVFKNHAAMPSWDERDDSCMVENLFRRIKTRVQYNHMVSWLLLRRV